VVTILVLAFYLLSEREKLDDWIENLFGMKKGSDIENVISDMEQKMGGWARGQFLLMLIIGISNYIGFRLLGIPFALPLAILAGLFEIVPYLGPILASVPAILIGFGISPFTGAAAISLAFLIQQLENYLLVPKIMEKSTGVSPIVTLLALAIGFKMAGVPGLLISVPVYILIQITLKHYFSSKVA
jgi:predicted PurR-regulated permease PerM